MTRCRVGGEGGHTSRSTPQGPRGSRGALTRALCVSILLLFALSPVLLLPPTIGESIDAPQTRAALAPKEPAHGFFIENRGQLSSEVRFYSLGSVDVGFRDDGVMFVAPDGDGIAAYLVRFDGANAVAPVGRDMLPFRTNYFLGNDPGGWRTDVPAYAGVAYPNLYEGIDLVYRPSSGGVKYEFSVHPGADPSTIRMRYEGVSSLAVEGGGLSIRMIRGVVRDSAPSSYERG